MIRRKKNLQTETPVLNKDTGVFENRKVKTSKEERREKKKKRNWPVSVVIINVNLLIVVTAECLYTSSMLTFLKNQNAYISDNTNVSLTEIATMKADIESTLQKENSLMENWKIELTDTDFSKEVYTVRIEIIPKEFTDTMDTFIYFGTTEFELEKDGFVYSGYASLPLAESYNGNVTVLFVDGNKRRTEIMSDFTGVNQSFDEVLSGSLSKMPLYEDNALKFNTNCDLKLDSKKYYNFEELSLMVEVDDEVVAKYAVDQLSDEINTIADVRATENGLTGAENLKQTSDAENDETSGDDNNSLGQMNITDENANTDGNQSTESQEEKEEETVKIKDKEGSYNWSDEIELPASQNPNASRKVRVYLIAKCKEGYTFTYDLFNGITNIAQQENSIAKGFKASENYYLGNAKVKDLKGGEYIIKKEDEKN